MNRKILFLGIGGIGVSGIALAAKKLGADVAGYDAKSTPLTKKLEAQQIKVFHNIDSIDVSDYDMLVYSSAIAMSNNLITKAQKLGISCLQRAMFLAVLMRDFEQNVAVTGTHGKTTTSSILASVLHQLDNKSSFVIGGMVKATNSNIEIRGTGSLVLEADESDASFLYLQPQVAIVTNIDLDHMATYQNNYEHLLENFYDFLNKESVRTIIICIDDVGCQDLLKRYSFADKKVITYGFSGIADIKVSDYKCTNGLSSFSVFDEIITTKLPGKYNVLNAVAAIIAAKEKGFSLEQIASAMKMVEGVARRFDIYNIDIAGGDVNVIDDYGHHPVEVSSCLQAVRDRFPNKQVIHVFQPHRYSRNRDLFSDWKKVLPKADKLMLLPTYAAGEEEISGATSKDLAKSLTNCKLVADFDAVKKELESLDLSSSVVLLQGAGDVTNLVEILQNDK